MNVKSRTEGFRRAGITFSAEGTEINVAELSLEQLKAIRGERNLVCPSDLDKVISEREAEADALAAEAKATKGKK